MSFIRVFRAGASALLTVALASSIAIAQGNGHGHDKRDRDDDDRAYDDHDHGRGHGHGHGHDRYADRDRDIHDWYRAHYDRLPPGLAKRDHLPPGLERQLVVNGTLPPGLQKKLQPCPRDLEVMLPPPPPNYVHVVIGGNLVMYNRATLQIGDVFRLDAAFQLCNTLLQIIGDLWFVFQRHKRDLRYGRFWLALAAFLMVHVTAFARTYPAWRMIWFSFIFVVEGPLFLVALDNVVHPRRYRKHVQ